MRFSANSMLVGPVITGGSSMFSTGDVHGGDGQRVAVLRLVVVGHARLRPQLARGGDEVEGGDVGAAEGVADGAAARRGRDGRADVHARGRVFEGA